jgi:hypothetical protein
MPLPKHLIAGALAGAMLASAGLAAQAFPFLGKPKAKTAATADAPSDTPPAASSAAPALPLDTAPPGASAANALKPLFQVKGFRSAAFGMTHDQVIAAIAADFKIPAAKVQETFSAQDRTTVLAVTVDPLEPGPGPAVVTYMLGASSKTLMRIGVVWTKPGDPSVEERRALASDGVILVDYFRGQAWPAGAVRAAAPIGPNALSLFSAQDAVGGAVAVNMEGVGYDEQVNGKTVSSPPPKGPAVLAVVYAQNAAHPDVYHLPPGAF